LKFVLDQNHNKFGNPST